ncbi:MAG TPA: DUF454 domain-containing protein [Bacteroidales bacterium]|nr:DUF454 domain-containing protein [Bacteroidales bacterium]
MLVRYIMITAGTLCLMLGVVGIFVPGLPTTPFFLLTAGLYVRSSDRLYQWLISNRYIGTYIQNWQTEKGLTLKAKAGAVILMWIMITSSVLFFIDSLPVRGIVIVVGLIGTLVMGFIVPTRRK